MNYADVQTTIVKSVIEIAGAVAFLYLVWFGAKAIWSTLTLLF